MPERQKVNQEIERLVEEYWDLEETSLMASSINRTRLVRELKGHSDATVEAAMREEALHWMERASDAAVWLPFDGEAFKAIQATVPLSEGMITLVTEIQRIVIDTASAGFRRGYASAREDMRKAGYVFPKRSRLDRTETAPDICTYEDSDKTKERDCE